MNTTNEEFRRLLRAGMASIAAWTNRQLPALDRHLGEQIGVSAATIERYRGGRIPRDRRTIAMLAEECVTHGFKNREWLERFLHSAGFDHAQDFIDRFFSSEPESEHPPASEKWGIMPVVHNLPVPDFAQFVMRQQAFERVVDGLNQRTAVVVIAGLGGTGKTSLACEVAACCLGFHRSDSMFPDIPWFESAVWISDKDSPGTTDLNAVLETIAQTLHLPDKNQSQDDTDRRLAIEYWLRRHRILLVVDNFDTITDLSLLEWLLRLPEPSKAIVTTRRYLPDFRHGTWIVELEGMTQTESLELISNRLRALRILELVPDITQLAPLFEVTGGNPKALEVATGLLKHTRQLQPIIDDLRTARGDLFDELFCRAWDGLSEEERDIMLAAPMFIGSSSKAALSAVAGVEGPVFDRALEHLQDLSLLNIHQSNLDEMPRYALHPLMRAFVQQKLHDEPHMHDTGRQRWVRYFIDLAASHLMNNRIEQPYWNTLILTDESIPAIDTELSGILDVLTWLQEQDKAQELLTLTLLIVHYLGRRAFFKPRLRFVQAAADAAHNLGEYNTEALLRIDALGWTYTEAGDYGQAERELQAGLHIAASLDAPDDRENLLALANAFLARVYAYQQAFEQAANHLQVALAAECQPIIRFRVLLTAGDVGHERRDYQAASRYYETILDLGAAHPDAGFDLGAIHHRWGLTLLQQGKLQEAEAAFNQFSRRVHQAKYRIREELKRYRESPATHYFAVEAIAAKHSAILLAAAEGNVTQAYMWAQEAKDELLRLNIKHRLLDQIEECLTMLTVTPDKEDVQQ